MTIHRDVPDPMTCDRFLELLPDLLDGDLAGPALSAATAHRAGCASCAGLVAELAQVTRSAAALPPLHPSRDLWGGIAARIEAPVVPLAVAPAAAGALVRSRRPWLAAAAALLLVAGTAGVTRQLTLRGVADAPAPSLAPLVADASGRDVPAAATSVPATGEPLGVTEVPTTADPRPVSRPASRSLAAAPRSAMQLASTEGTALEAAAAYDEELVALRAVLDERRTTLDSATVLVLESNLAIIDRAIAESRAALLRDPASRFLNERLSTAVQDKLQLMRTAVLISND